MKNSSRLSRLFYILVGRFFETVEDKIDNLNFNLKEIKERCKTYQEQVATYKARISINEQEIQSITGEIEQLNIKADLALKNGEEEVYESYDNEIVYLASRKQSLMALVAQHMPTYELLKEGLHKMQDEKRNYELKLEQVKSSKVLVDARKGAFDVLDKNSDINIELDQVAKDFNFEAQVLSEQDILNGANLESKRSKFERNIEHGDFTERKQKRLEKLGISPKVSSQEETTQTSN